MSFLEARMKKPDESLLNGFVAGAVFGWIIGLVAPAGGALVNCLLGSAAAVLLGILTTTTLGIRFPLAIGFGLSAGFGAEVFFCNNLLAKVTQAIGGLPSFRTEWAPNLLAAVLSAAAILITTVIVYFIKLFLVKIYLKVRKISA